MLKLYIGDNVADLPENVSIRISRSNPAYLGEDVDVIKSTFSYPFDLPLTARNRSLLSYPDRLDNAMPLPQDLPARLVAGPDTILVGRVNCLSATGQTAKVYFVNNPLGDLAKVNMNEVDLGSYSYTSTAAMQANLRDTYVNPTARPYVVFPIFNSALNPEPGDVSANDNQFQNSYDFSTGNFRMNLPISLFLRTEYVLRSAIESLGFSWTDLFHITDEHKRITIVTNRALNNEDGPVTLSAPYNTLMPETSVSEFLKQYCRLFNLAPFSDLSGSSLTLQPLAPLIGNAPAKDWTAYQQQNPNRIIGEGVKRYAFPSLEGLENYRFDKWRDLGNPDQVVDNFPIENIVPERLYYVLSRNTYVKFYEQENGTFLGDFTSSHGSIENAKGSEEVVPSIPAVQQSQILFYPEDGDNCLMPVWSAELASPLVSGDEEQNDTVQIALAIFRGQQRTSGNKLYPFGSMNNFRVDTVKLKLEKLTLRWIGEDGLYENHHREWDDMLKSASPSEHTFLLPLSELIGFDFRDKVRVQNRNYFVREMEFELSSGGVSPTACTLVSVS